MYVCMCVCVCVYVCMHVCVHHASAMSIRHSCVHYCVHTYGRVCVDAVAAYLCVSQVQSYETVSWEGGKEIEECAGNTGT